MMKILMAWSVLTAMVRSTGKRTPIAWAGVGIVVQEADLVAAAGKADKLTIVFHLWHHYCKAPPPRSPHWTTAATAV
ncbi:MAG: hypothetical protein NTU53_17975 [Planctomycetota bacterium]|nr:hypothetical protein [Planctomycetota bacterium]